MGTFGNRYRPPSAGRVRARRLLPCSAWSHGAAARLARRDPLPTGVPRQRGRRGSEHFHVSPPCVSPKHPHVSLSAGIPTRVPPRRSWQVPPVGVPPTRVPPSATHVRPRGPTRVPSCSPPRTSHTCPCGAVPALPSPSSAVPAGRSPPPAEPPFDGNPRPGPAPPRGHPPVTPPPRPPAGTFQPRPRHGHAPPSNESTALLPTPPNERRRLLWPRAATYLIRNRGGEGGGNTALSSPKPRPFPACGRCPAARGCCAAWGGRVYTRGAGAGPEAELRP